MYAKGVRGIEELSLQGIKEEIDEGADDLSNIYTFFLRCSQIRNGIRMRILKITQKGYITKIRSVGGSLHGVGQPNRHGSFQMSISYMGMKVQ